MQSKAGTVAEYLDGLTPDRRAIIERVLAVVKKNLHKDFEVGMQYGMIGFYIPHKVFAPGYHCDPKQPLPFGGLASQKNHCSLHLMALYQDGQLYQHFVAEWKKSNKKLDMGQCCIRFKTADDLELDLIGRTIKSISAQDYIDEYVKVMDTRKSGTGAKASPSAKKKATKKTAQKSTKAPVKRKAR